MGEARQAAELMAEWAMIHTADALELLSPSFKSEEVRGCLHHPSGLQGRVDMQGALWQPFLPAMHICYYSAAGHCMVVPGGRAKHGQLHVLWSSRCCSLALKHSV